MDYPSSKTRWKNMHPTRLLCEQNKALSHFDNCINLLFLECVICIKKAAILMICVSLFYNAHYIYYQLTCCSNLYLSYAGRTYSSFVPVKINNTISAIFGEKSFRMKLKKTFNFGKWNKNFSLNVPIHICVFKYKMF